MRHKVKTVYEKLEELQKLYNDSDSELRGLKKLNSKISKNFEENRQLLMKSKKQVTETLRRVQPAEQRAVFLEELMLEIYKENSIDKIKEISGFAIQSNKFI